MPDILDEVGGVSGTLVNRTGLHQTGLVLGSGFCALFHAASSDGIDFGDVYDFPALAPFTIEAWVKPVSFQSPGTIISKEGGSGGYSLTATSAAVSFRRFAADNSFDDCTWTPSAGLWQTGTVYHVVGTYDGTTMRLYVNGLLRASVASSKSVPAITVPYRLGLRSVGGQGWDGYVDESAVYDRALTAAEVAGNYQTGTGTSALTTVGASRTLSYAVGGPIGVSRVLPYTVRTAIGTSRALAYGVRSLVGGLRALNYQVRTSIGASRLMLYQVSSLNTVGVVRALPYLVRTAIGMSRELRYMVGSAPGASIFMSYVVRTPDGASLVLSYTVFVEEPVVTGFITIDPVLGKEQYARTRRSRERQEAPSGYWGSG